VQTPISFQSIAGATVGDGVLSGVSVITEGVAKGHGVYIDAQTLLEVKACAETHPDGVQVKIDHGTGFSSIVGVLKNFRIEGPKLLADLHLLKTHEEFETIVEIARAMPGSVGLSISFSGGVEDIDGKNYARCVELYSVDFVDRPAANPSGLYRSVDSPPEGMANDKSESFFAGLKQWIGVTESADLSAAQKQVTELSIKVVTFEADLKSATEKATKLEADLKAKTDELAKLPELIKAEGSKEAQRIMASLGQPPVTSTPASAPAVPPKEDTSKLSPHERVIAHFKAQTAAKATANLIAK
jgi:hypothetical protein